MIEQALTETRSELKALDQRREELLEQIERAETILGSSGSQPRRKEARPMTLHTALVRILEDNGNEWMTARELADGVNRRGLYRKRDGSAVEVNQVHARTSNYARLFEKDGPRIRLKKGATVMTTHAPDVVMFKDDDEGFFDWQDDNSDGYFINTERKPNPKYLVLHKAGCPHFKGSESLRWTKDYVKICSGDRTPLEEWATEAVGGEVTLCRTCFA